MNEGTVGSVFSKCCVSSEVSLDLIVAVTELILESLSSSETLADSFMVLHAAFVGALYRVLGIDFGKLKLLTPLNTF